MNQYMLLGDSSILLKAILIIDKNNPITIMAVAAERLFNTCDKNIANAEYIIPAIKNSTHK